MHPSSASPPVTGAMSGEHLPLGSSPGNGQPPISPSNLSFSKQPLPRSMSGQGGRPPYNQSTGSSPFIPSSLERESIIHIPTSANQQLSHVTKRYSSSLSQRAGRIGSQGSSAETAGAPGGGNSVPGSIGQSNTLLRRTSTRESGLRHSHEAPPPGTVTTVPDDDDIQSFLKTLEALPQPPSLAAHAASSRARLPSASSSISNTSVPQSSSPLQTSSTGPQPTSAFAGRTPMTRKQVDDALKRMTGSFTANARTLEQSSIMPTSTDVSRSHSQVLAGSQSQSSRTDVAPSNRSSLGSSPSVGLLTASRPSPVPRRVSPASLGQTDHHSRPINAAQHPSISGSGQPSSLGRSSSVKKNSPLSGVPLQAPPSHTLPPHSPPRTKPQPPLLSQRQRDPDPEAVQTALPPSPPRTTSPTKPKGAARSLPAGPAPLAEDSPIPSRSQRPSGFLSPQATGTGSGSGSANRTESASASIRAGSAHRRGPVLLRGGFDGRPTSTARSSQRQSVSPSHSPIRDFSRLTSPRIAATGEDQAVQALGSWKRYRSANFDTRPPIPLDPSSEAASTRPAATATTTVGTTGGGSIPRRQSTGTEALLDNQARTTTQGTGGGAGQRTAPSSFGRQREEGDYSDSVN